MPGRTKGGHALFRSADSYEASEFDASEFEASGEEFDASGKKQGARKVDGGRAKKPGPRKGSAATFKNGKKRPARMQKGTPAAKAHMAKLRAMRKDAPKKKKASTKKGSKKASKKKGSKKGKKRAYSAEAPVASGAKLVKGSAEAKARMAQLREMRGQ